MYGDVPPQDAYIAASADYPWLVTYEHDRSFQELEVCSVFPELQLTKDSTAAERKKARMAASEKLKHLMENDSPKKRYLIAQRGFNFIQRVPEEMRSVFKDPVYR